MRRSRLRNKFMDSKTDADRIAYNKEPNYCVSLMQKQKKAYYSNLKTRDVTDSKTFWKKSKTSFWRKDKFANKHFARGKRE